MSPDTKAAANEEFIPLMRELTRAYQAFAAYDALGYRNTDLTVPQADVVFTLGNTDGLTFREISEKTLITKGTLNRRNRPIGEEGTRQTSGLQR